MSVNMKARCWSSPRSAPERRLSSTRPERFTSSIAPSLTQHLDLPALALRVAAGRAGRAAFEGFEGLGAVGAGFGGGVGEDLEGA